MLFVNCSIEEIQYRNHKLINGPINLDMIASFICDKYVWTADEKGLPAIRFHMGYKDGSSCWVYPTIEARDQDFDWLLKTFTKGRQ